MMNKSVSVIDDDVDEVQILVFCFISNTWRCKYLTYWRGSWEILLPFVFVVVNDDVDVDGSAAGVAKGCNIRPSDVANDGIIWWFFMICWISLECRTIRIGDIGNRRTDNNDFFFWSSWWRHGFVEFVFTWTTNITAFLAMSHRRLPCVFLFGAGLSCRYDGCCASVVVAFMPKVQRRLQRLLGLIRTFASIKSSLYVVLLSWF